MAKKPRDNPAGADTGASDSTSPADSTPKPSKPESSPGQATAEAGSGPTSGPAQDLAETGTPAPARSAALDQPDEALGAEPAPETTAAEAAVANEDAAATENAAATESAAATENTAATKNAAATESAAGESDAESAAAHTEATLEAPTGDAAKRGEDAAETPAAPAAGDGSEPPSSARQDGAGGGDRRTPNGPKPAAWGRPLMRLDEFWTRFEMRLVTGVLALEVFALTLWVVLKGMSASSEGETSSNAGIVFRAVIGAVLLGMITYAVLKKQKPLVRRAVTMGSIGVGLFVAKYWTHIGVDYSSNLLNWYQQASSLTLLGGLRGIGTRLTLLLALVGGSLATGAGKHITIDVVTRLVKPEVRKWMMLTGWVATSAICFVASWGFFDHVAIESFGARNTDTAGEKISKTTHELGENFFIARKQLGLDFKTLPHVLKGESYSKYLTGAEWNKWLEESGMVERYGREKVDGIKVPDDARRSPIIVIPGKGEPRGELISTANLVFPIGLFIIALRFLLLVLLVLSGHRGVDPEEDLTFRAEDETPTGDPPPDPPGERLAESASAGSADSESAGKASDGESADSSPGGDGATPKDDTKAQDPSGPTPRSDRQQEAA